jgi:hypothetical protein
MQGDTVWPANEDVLQHPPWPPEIPIPTHALRNGAGTGDHCVQENSGEARIYVTPAAFGQQTNGFF